VILVKVQSQYGCVEWDTMFVTVSDQREVFVPNAFTPNGDGINDFAEVFPGTNIVEIEVFEIFDRWGNNVFGASNFAAGDIVARWDGNYRSQPLNPGLFVYLLKVRDVRGEIKHQVGEISLIR
jgi:gliding motility-associated-like protein